LNTAYQNRLYRQKNDGTFSDVTAAAGLTAANNSYGMGVAIADYDNGGFADIYVTILAPTCCTEIMEMAHSPM
jgi:hypothetical protein